MSKKSFGPALLVALGLIFIAAIGYRTISTPEIWSHLAQGRHNVPLSFLESDSPVNTTWLYDKLAYTAWTIGKAPLLILLNIAGLLATFGLLLRVSRKWGGALSQGFALLIAGHLLFQALDVGPQIVMMLCIALTLYLLTEIKSPVLLFATLIPLQILWTNLHGSFIYGPLMAALAAVQVLVQSRARSAGRTRKKQDIEAGTYGILAAAMLIASAANPYFFKMHAQVIAGITTPAAAYWTSLFIDFFQIPAIKPLILFTTVLGAAGLITLKKKLPILLTAMAVYGTLMIWNTPQMAPLFVAMAFPFIVLSLTAVSEYLHGSLEQMLGRTARFLPQATSVVFVLLIILSLMPVVTNCAYAKSGSASNFGLGIEEQLYPVGADIVINDPAFPDKAINLAADGGYLAFRYPDRKIFIDYRGGRYDKQLLADLNATLLGSREAYNHIYETYRPEAFIINTLYPASAQGIVTLLSTRLWKLAYFDGITAVLLLNKQEFSGILGNTDAQEQGLARLEQARATFADEANSCRAGNPAELIGAGKVFLAFNRPYESKSIFALLLQHNPSVPGAWIGLGNSQLLLKEFEEAAASLKTATKMAPGNYLAWRSYAITCRLCSERLEADRKAYFAAEYEVALEKVRHLEEISLEKEEAAEVMPEEEPAQSADLEITDLPMEP